MADGLGKQIMGELGKVGQAMTADAVTGLQKIGEKTAASTVETLTGGVVKLGSANQGNKYEPGVGGAPSDPQQFQEWKATKEQAARRRHAQVQEQLRAVIERQRVQQQQAVRVEQQEKQQLKIEESNRERVRNETIAKAQKGGGTGEVRGGKF